MFVTIKIKDDLMSNSNNWTTFVSKFFLFIQVQNAAGCQLLCYHKSICQFWSWWSGDILSNICVFHKDCERLHLDCEHCFAGPKIPPPTGCHPTLYSNESSPVFDDTTSSIIFGVACANVGIFCRQLAIKVNLDQI